MEALPILGWFLRRTKEKSTMRGGALLAMLLGFYIGPDQADIVVAALGSLWGVVDVVRSEGAAK